MTSAGSAAIDKDDALEVLFENDRLLVTHKSGHTGKAVISFAGIGLGLGGVPKEEFVKTLAGNDHDQYFVVDKLRGWYNATSEEIIQVLAKHLPRHDSCITLGNSMGGFGAVYFASQLPGCTAALAFGPQYSVNPEIAPKERRWLKWRSRIDNWTVPHALAGANPDIRLYLFFGETSDRYQSRLYKRNILPRMSLFILAQQKHHTAAYLRDRGMLLPILEAVWRDIETESLRSMLYEAGIETLDTDSLLRPKR